MLERRTYRKRAPRRRLTPEQEIQLAIRRENEDALAKLRVQDRPAPGSRPEGALGVAGDLDLGPRILLPSRELVANEHARDKAAGQQRRRVERLWPLVRPRLEAVAINIPEDRSIELRLMGSMPRMEAAVQAQGQVEEREAQTDRADILEPLEETQDRACQAPEDQREEQGRAEAGGTPSMSRETRFDTSPRLAACSGSSARSGPSFPLMPAAPRLSRRHHSQAVCLRTNGYSGGGSSSSMPSPTASRAARAAWWGR